MSSNVKAAAILGACVVVAAVILGRQVSRLADIVEQKQFASSFSMAQPVREPALPPGAVAPRDEEIQNGSENDFVRALRATVEKGAADALRGVEVGPAKIERIEIGGFRYNVNANRAWVAGTFHLSDGQSGVFHSNLPSDGLGNYSGRIGQGDGTVLVENFSVPAPASGGDHGTP